MDIFGILSLLGGLALFLYGMTVMGDSLVMLSGGKLEKILEKLTDNKLKGLLLGTLVTAVIQSSSATTVMVVGFVNSSIMNLEQAVGVIMGANIGTTVTPWILSLSGIQGSNVIVKLLKPSSFSPILAAIGVIMMMTAQEGSKKRTVGNIFLGFAVLMFGMETMSAAVSPLRDNPAFTSMLTAFSNPLLGILAGAILTAVIQSSSASVGVLQALCISGVISYGAAIPIIMGQNIGTCVTALISSIGTSKNAKRAAFIHFYFNLIGTTIFVIGFYTINSFVHFSFLNTLATAVGIAVIHSLFNIGNSIVLFPFTKGLVKLATLTVREREEDVKKSKEPDVLTALSDHFLESPSFAMRLCKNAVDEMARLSKESILLAMEVTKEYSGKKIDKIISIEQQIDYFEDVLGSYLVKLAGKDLSIDDSHLLSVLLHTIGDFERISDHAVNVTEAAQRLNDENITMSDIAQRELESLTVAVRDIIGITETAFIEEDLMKAVAVEPLEAVINELVREMKQRHIYRLRTGTCSIDAGLILEDFLTNYERVSDHCSNIAATMIEAESDAMDKHEYTSIIARDSEYFKEEYRRLKGIYILP